MVKMIIADDEKWVRKNIVSIIPFQAIGITLACEASNGLEALEMCREHKPDILLTDIKMPGLNGLELIHEIKKDCPDIKVVILSGYSDFEYAKSAIRDGVTDYLLKPVDEDELTQVLTRLRDSILKDRERILKNNLMQSQFGLALPALYEKLLNQLILPSNFTLETIKANLSKHNLDFNYPCFTLLIASPDVMCTPASDKLFDSFKLIFRRIVKKYLKGITFSIPSKNYHLGILLNHPQQLDQNQLSSAFKLCAKVVSKRLGCTFSMGISSQTQQINKLPDLYQQSCSALEERFWNSHGGIYFFNTPRKSKEAVKFEKHLSKEEMDNIILNITTNNLDSAYHAVNQIFTELNTYKHIKPEMIKEFSWNLVQSILNELDIHLSFIEYEGLFSPSVHPYEKLKHTETYDSLKTCVKELLQHIFQFYTDKNPKANNSSIDAAKKLIEQNYYKDISLEQISKYVHLNPTYFSELFKKETGMSFIDYKTLLRIDHAKKFILSTDMSINEISSKVGYNDPKYFSQLFKKLTGLTILDFKKKSSKF